MTGLFVFFLLIKMVIIMVLLLLLVVVVVVVVVQTVRDSCYNAAPTATQFRGVGGRQPERPTFRNPSTHLCAEGSCIT